ncbi:hypothetical protein SAY86_007694 [Trapa natans]|uniref:Uncharacterized protein n=1 Tax=Trapa natans TaxID=22666 RepID=A0AAN7R0J0_TRANT|nr:hypothetical protein SAY86_007694 [Trapa natans]
MSVKPEILGRFKRQAVNNLDQLLLGLLGSSHSPNLKNPPRSVTLLPGHWSGHGDNIRLSLCSQSSDFLRTSAEVRRRLIPHIATSNSSDRQHYSQSRTSSFIFDPPPRSRFLEYWLSLSMNLIILDRAKVSEEASYPPLVGESDLLIVGPGVLGRLVAEQWRKEFPGSQIYGQTATTNHHDELIKMGINPLLKGSEFAYSVPYVIFCAPPSQSLDYPGDLRIAASKWSGEGSFLFTSSSALYDCSDNGPCNEDTPIIPLGRSPKTDVLLNAEKVVLDSGGCVLRLAGLYISFMESAHTFWLKKGIVEARPDHFLNLIHYEDAASLSVTILKNKLRSRVFMGCDNHPVTRQEVMDLIAGSGKFNQKFEGFTGTDGPLGKRLNNLRTREEIGWQPKYKSFSAFLGVSD